MKNTIKIIKILLVFIATLFAGTTKAIDYLVANSSNANANGTYVQMESCDYLHPIYVRSSGGTNYVIHGTNSSWNVSTYISNPCIINTVLHQRNISNNSTPPFWHRME